MHTARPAVALLVVLAAAAPTTLPSDEVPPAKSVECFPGAIYRKAVSSDDVWSGIDCVVTLPTFTPDPARVGANGRPLDNPSCYIGGRAGETEIDAGVSWEVIREPDGKVSKERKAFRPFWRNKKWFTGAAKPELYFYPGDTIRMTCKCDAPNKLTIRVELVSRAAGSAAPVGGVVEETFDAFGFGPGKVQQFKRVSAIDQVGNEGKQVAATKATVTGAAWSSVALLRGDERRPMTAARYTDMRCPDARHVVVKGNEDAEQIDLVGAPAK